MQALQGSTGKVDVLRFSRLKCGQVAGASTPLTGGSIPPGCFLERFGGVNNSKLGGKFFSGGKL